MSNRRGPLHAELLSSENPEKISQIQERLDRRVTLDLERLSEPGRVAAIKAAHRSLEFWLDAAAIVEKGRFSKEDQQAMSEAYGDYSCSKLKTLLQNTPKGELPQEITYFLKQSEAELRKLDPTDLEARLSDAVLAVQARLKGPTHSKPETYEGYCPADAW